MNLRKMNGAREAEIIVKTWAEIVGADTWFCAQVRGCEVMRSRHSVDRASSYARAVLAVEVAR